MSGAAPPTEYVSWQHPAAGYIVEYALPVFQDIEILVSDAFRRIPHGGIETGGLLFGTLTGSLLRISAFVQIECEHAQGPSFHLSDRDLERLEEQLSKASADPGLAGTLAVGWFIAHTRSELVLSERELELFSRFFPEPGRVTVLVKPEKFKPARFACLIRDRSQHVETHGDSIAFVLPAVPERVGSAQRHAPTITAPPDMAVADVAVADMAVADIAVPDMAVPESPAPNVSAASITERRIDEPDSSTERSAPRRPPAAPHWYGLEDTGRIAPEINQPSQLRPEPDSTRKTEPLPTLPHLSRLRMEESEPEPNPSFRPNLFTWTIFGACVVFAALTSYGFYLQFTPAVVPVTITPNAATLVVSWPAAETRGVGDAELRIDNGPALELSSEDKDSGTYSLQRGSGDVIVDLVVHHRFRTARGITRYLITPPGSVRSGRTQ